MGRRITECYMITLTDDIAQRPRCRCQDIIKIESQTKQIFYVLLTCISIESCKEKPTRCTTYYQYISSTSTCFGRIQAYHQEVKPYVYNNLYLLFFFDDCLLSWGPPLWSSGQSFWLQIQRSRVRFPALPDFLSSSGSGTGSTQPRGQLRSYLNKKQRLRSRKQRLNGRGEPLR